ncbi:hypothetical protein ACFX1Q_044809 [Malus domestica]
MRSVLLYRLYYSICSFMEEQQALRMYDTSNLLLNLLFSSLLIFLVCVLIAPSMLQNLHCGDGVTIEGQTYTISAVTRRYRLRKGKYEPSEKRLDVLSTARYVLNLYLENWLEQS